MHIALVHQRATLDVAENRERGLAAGLLEECPARRLFFPDRRPAPYGKWLACAGARNGGTP